MQWFLQQHSLELGDEANVKTAAMLAKQMAYQNKVSRITFLQMLPLYLWLRQHRGMAQLAMPLPSARIMVFLEVSPQLRARCQAGCCV